MSSRSTKGASAGSSSDSAVPRLIPKPLLVDLQNPSAIHDPLAIQDLKKTSIDANKYCSYKICDYLKFHLDQGIQKFNSIDSSEPSQQEQAGPYWLGLHDDARLSPTRSDLIDLETLVKKDIQKADYHGHDVVFAAIPAMQDNNPFKATPATTGAHHRRRRRGKRGRKRKKDPYRNKSYDSASGPKRSRRRRSRAFTAAICPLCDGAHRVDFCHILAEQLDLLRSIAKNANDRTDGVTSCPQPVHLTCDESQQVDKEDEDSFDSMSFDPSLIPPMSPRFHFFASDSCVLSTPDSVELHIEPSQKKKVNNKFVPLLDAIDETDPDSEDEAIPSPVILAIPTPSIPQTTAVNIIEHLTQDSAARFSLAPHFTPAVELLSPPADTSVHGGAVTVKTSVRSASTIKPATKDVCCIRVPNSEFAVYDKMSFETPEKLCDFGEIAFGYKPYVRDTSVFPYSRDSLSFPPNIPTHPEVHVDFAHGIHHTDSRFHDRAQRLPTRTRRSHVSRPLQRSARSKFGQEFPSPTASATIPYGRFVARGCVEPIT